MSNCYYLFDGVQLISRDEAFNFYKVNHYLGKPAALNWVHFGLVENSVLVACVSFGYPAGPPVIDAYFEDHEGFKIRELVRLAANKNRGTLSFFVMSSIKAYCKYYYVDAVISYADSQYHHGGIYQACSFLYCGETKPSTRYIDERGKHQHRRTNGKNLTKDQILERGLVSCKSIKYRYLYLYKRNKRNLLKRLKYKVLNYPKR